MKNHYGFGIAAIATITTALALNGCDRRSDDFASRQVQPSTTLVVPATTPSNSVDAAGTSTTQKIETGLDDSAITAKVKAALLADPGLQSLAISVDTKNGAVTLSGQVDSTAVRDHAKQVASTVQGVGMVVDQISVKSNA
jgi:hyperosmotically inducible protein